MRTTGVSDPIADQVAAYDFKMLIGSTFVAGTDGAVRQVVNPRCYPSRRYGDLEGECDRVAVAGRNGKYRRAGS